MTDTTVPYQLASTAEWAESVRATFQFRASGEAWDYIGKCPRCGHQVSKRVETGGTTTYRLGEGSRQGAMTVRCNCQDFEHDGRPDGSKGCGAYAAIEVEWPEKGGAPRVTGAGSATAEDLRWDERAADLAFNELPNLRSAAEKWVASLGTVIGVFGVVLVVKGPGDIAKIQSAGLYVLAGVLLAGAVACALTAIVLGAFAAQGGPRKVDRYTGEYIRSRYRHEARVAAKQLRRSRLAAVVAVVLLGGAIGTTWYGTPRTSAKDETGSATSDGVHDGCADRSARGLVLPS